MKKSMFATILAAAGLVSLASCGNNDCPAEQKPVGEAEGKVLNVMCWNNEFQQRFESFYPDFVGQKKEGSITYDMLRDGTKVRFIIEPNDNNNYQNKLDAALKAQESTAADEKIDMFLIEADYATKYTKSDYTLDLKADIGLTDADLAEQYQYTKDIVTVDGKLKATSWQATPGLFAYRRDLAQQVLGVSEPADVQKELSDWTKFNAVAKKAHEKGIKMLSGFADNFRPYSNNMEKPWVEEKDGEKVVRLDPKIKEWIVTTKDYATKGYIDDVKLWSGQWQADQGPQGHEVVSGEGDNQTVSKGKLTFGFFYSTWGINFTLAGNADPQHLGKVYTEDGKLDVSKSLYGDYAVCEGPASWYWGGSWLCAAKGTDNKGLVNDVMYKLTCSQQIAKSITRETQDYTNNKAAMHSIATDATYGSDFLGGQNHIALFENSAAKISMKNAGPYDQTLNEGIQNAFEPFFFGTATYQSCLTTYKSTVEEKVNGLTFAPDWASWDGVSL